MPSRRTRLALLFAILLLASLASAATVGKWRRHVVSLPNASFTGNPFELEVDGTFTHTASGTTFKLPGYYAGSNTWKIGFMPTLTGEWTWTTSSNDPDSDVNGDGTVNVLDLVVVAQHFGEDASAC